MLRLFIILIFLLPLNGLAQYVISGKIINATDKKPVADASVFLSNTTVGGKTRSDGSFTLNSVRPGQYDLVVSSIGFETFHVPVMANDNIILPAIEISPKTILLNEVKINPNNNWERDYQTFKRLFLGTSEYAEQCKILNPEILDFDFDAATRVFTAKSSDFLEIENKALGYKLRYQLIDLTSDYKSGIVYFEGPASFEELKGTPAEQRRWQKNRLKAYEGSSMHFLRSTIGNTMESEGFRVLRLIRKPDPNNKGNATKYTQYVLPTLLVVQDMVRLTDVKGQFALSFNDCLYVMYNKKKIKANDTTTVTQIKVPRNLNDPSTTTIVFDEPYTYFDSNGVIINPQSVIFDGNWGKSLIPELLPVDYVPY